MRQVSSVLILVVISIPLNALPSAAGSNNRSLPLTSEQSAKRVIVTSDSLTARESTYYFSMILPKQSEKPFIRLSITEQSSGQAIDLIRFDLKKTQAFLGTPDSMGQAVAVRDTWIDETGTIWVELAPPLPPGTKLTLSLKTKDLPAQPLYQFGIAAYPTSKPSVPVFVGNGVLRIN
jgi:hypothetical protein